MPQQRWTREQDLAVLYLRHVSIRQSAPEFGEIARAMNRTPASILMRKGNFDSLDPSVPGVGLSNAANLTRNVWREYERDPEGVLAEARKAYLRLISD